ncbi:MAG: flagellar hook assembly protein FlgD [Gammaproteobacteria bacterium]
MSTITDFSNQGLSALAPSSASAAPASSSGNLDQEDFLKLMTEQLKAQDPMNPGDTGEFLGQMAQFASVSGIQGLQQSVESLATSLQSSQALQASSLVGRTVLSTASSASLGENGSIEGSFEMPADARSATLSILDASGETVHTQTLSGIPGDRQNFSWDGMDEDGYQASPGIYHIQAQALSGDTTTALPTQIAQRVESVSMGTGDEGLTLNLEGGSRITASAIEQLR